tara:strand:+ start:377 stop:616 length:240 start_codon:yes stop_codon:yes gene_type:complete
MNDAEKGFNAGYEATVENINLITKELETKELELPHVLSGILCAVFNCTYALTPNKDVAEFFINNAKEMALKDIKNEDSD